jgi:hypothetical protein
LLVEPETTMRPLSFVVSPAAGASNRLLIDTSNGQADQV